MEIKVFTVNMLQENTYVVHGEGDSCVVIDPGFLDPEESMKVISYLSGLKPAAVLLTHGHMDHIYGVTELHSRFGVPVYMSPEDVKTMDYLERLSKFGVPVADRSFPITPVTDGQTVEAAGLSFKAISTPGHSPGSICWLMEKEEVIFTGDTLFAGAIGRTDLIYGSYDDEIRSIMEKLIWLDSRIQIYPGHGGPSTIGTERVSNPFLEPFNEREEIPELNEL
ncbi:MAG: MBL fold metallo-hydrolase [Bacteroidales bacterium]|nr:MBL fold metallo-hydrolase [Bacteroidales bacterium]